VPERRRVLAERSAPIPDVLLKLRGARNSAAEWTGFYVCAMANRCGSRRRALGSDDLETFDSADAGKEAGVLRESIVADPICWMPAYFRHGFAPFRGGPFNSQNPRVRE